VLPRIRTPTGPNTVVTSDEAGSIAIWDLREPLDVPSRSMQSGLGCALGLSWHPSNPDLLAVCGGGGATEIKVLSVGSGTEVNSFELKGKARGVGIYGELLVAGTGEMEFFKFGSGKRSIGSLSHTTVGCFNTPNVHLFHDRGLFSNGDDKICAFKY